MPCGGGKAHQHQARSIVCHYTRKIAYDIFPHSLNKKSMQLFFSLWPSEALRTELTPHRLEVLRHCGGRPSSHETLHMTLAFVGRVPEPRIAELIAIGSGILQPSFDYKIDVAACFGKANVAWLGAQNPPDELMNLQATLQTAVLEAGFPNDPREFRPHVTVARGITQFVEPWLVDPVVWRVNQFSLIKATSTPHGVQYESLRDWSLRG
jgi:RNA 2',3'-cyclic 3'-phosphodiesterase